MPLADVTDASDPFSPTSDEINPPDIIVRSSDMVDFHAHKAILSFGSIVFKNMFSFPEPVEEDANPTKDGKSIVVLPEDSHAVEKLLVLCYPRFTSSYLFRHLSGLDAAYKAAGKYQIPGGQHLLLQVLEDPRLMTDEPHRVFAIACHLGLEKVARAAAIETLRLSYPDHPVPEFKFISAHQLWQLHQYRLCCARHIVAFLEKYLDSVDLGDAAVRGDDHPEPHTVWWESASGHHPGCGAIESDEDCFLFPAQWYRDHVERVKTAAIAHPDARSVQDALGNIRHGPTLAAISDCARCLRLAPGQLHIAAEALNFTATRMYKQIVSKFSFLE